jgi:hypothetical protein
MQSVSFENKNKTVHILFQDKKVIYDNVFYPISVSINTKDIARFSFSHYQAKINRNLLSINNTLDGSFETFNLSNNLVETSDSEWIDYKYHSDVLLSINKNGDKIKLGDNIYQVTKKTVKGIYTEYYTEVGTLLLTKVQGRQCMFDNIFISRA